MEATTTERKFLTYEQAAAEAQMHRVTLWRAVRRGELKVGGTPAAPRFHRKELERWLEEGPPK